MSGYGSTKDVFLWCMSAIYLMAFASLYTQIPGLYGDNGILPAKLVLKQDVESIEELLEGQPTILKLTPKLGLDAQSGMDLLCLMGILLSFFGIIIQAARDCVTFTLLWILYLSVYQVGQTFLWFQWDILLLETGFLTIIVAPIHLQLPRKWKMSDYHQHDSITMWLVKWLLFRLMFASGVVKLTSKCPTWWGLTALTWHFESQCIPTPVAWFWHQLPEWFLKLSCVATYIIEIPIAFLFFAPTRNLRIFAFYCQILLQLLIIVTGNYNFFNLLTIVLCISLLDDKYFGRSTERGTSWVGSFINLLFSLSVYGYLGYQAWAQFSLKVKFEPTFSIESKIAFSQNEFQSWLDRVVPWTMTMGAVSLGYEVLLAIVRSLVEERGTIKKVASAVQCILFGVVAAAMVGVSLVPHAVVSVGTYRNLPTLLRNLHSKTSTFEIANSYGLFRSMTGVGGRPEVIVEGSNHLDKGWKEYEFLYKPGNLSRAPPLVAPHQPRLDWQMWFAALGTYQHNTWFINMVYRLLHNQPEVLQLIDHNPFPHKPPKYIRATLYHYHYTQSNSKTSGNWWTRQKKSDYMPPITKDEPTLLDYLRHEKMIDNNKSKKSSSNSYLLMFIRWIREEIGQPEGFMFVTSLIGTALAIRCLSIWFKNH